MKPFTNNEKYDIQAIFRVRKPNKSNDKNLMHQTSGREGFHQK